MRLRFGGCLGQALKPKESNIVIQRLVGGIQPWDIRLYLDFGAWQKIQEYGESHPSLECGGVLLGNQRVENGTIFVEIHHFLPAKYTQSTPVSLTFTHETWADIIRGQEQDFPNETIVGWQHTHPGLGGDPSTTCLSRRIILIFFSRWHWWLIL